MAPPGNSKWRPCGAALRLPAAVLLWASPELWAALSRASGPGCYFYLEYYSVTLGVPAFVILFFVLYVYFKEKHKKRLF